MYTVQIPNLHTLVKPPSWCKSSGNIDRSACIEVRVREVRRLAGCVIYRKPWKYPYQGKRIGVRPLPCERAAETSAGRVTTGLHFITADELLDLVGRRPPRMLRGDFRTTRAQAMRPEQWTPFRGIIDQRGWAPMVGKKTKRPQKPRTAKGFRNRYTARRTALPEWDFGLDANPNKGASRSKLLGISSDWFQPLRIEKWRVGGVVAWRYWLICPGNPTVKGSLGHGKILSQDWDRISFDHWAYAEMSGKERWALARRDERFAPLSTARTGFKRRGCPQRVLKLYLVMCTKAERDDARLAQRWIASLPPRVYAKHMPFIGQVVNRYGILFSPRTLLCRQCLGLHYGNHPDSARDSWWRCRKGMLPPA